MDSFQPAAAKGPLITPELLQAAATLPVSTQSKGKGIDVSDDEESEWEYEYSNTETETYYLTVDMSHKDLVKKPDHYVMNTRGGYKTWVNPLFGSQDGESTKPSAFGDEDDNGGDDDPLPEPEGQDEDNDEEEGNGRDFAHNNGEDSAKDDQPAGEIQVLELHSKNPMIWYRGRVFSASWASNIGTELLFATQDPASENQLPALRHLPGDVDLLAASSARLLTAHVDLTPNDGGAKGGLAGKREHMDKKLESTRKKHNIFIPVMGDRYGKRAPQARFLENLQALKKLKGEKDEVTVGTTETRQNHVEDDPDEVMERRKRAKATERHRRNNEKRNEKLKETLGEAYARRGSGRPRGKGSRGPNGPRMALNLMDPRLTTVSTATPEQWNELGRTAAGREDDIVMRDAAGDDNDDDWSEDEA